MNRQPSGTPIGGQFAEGRKPEGGDLSESLSVHGLRVSFENAVNRLVDPNAQLDEVDYDTMMHSARRFFDDQPVSSMTPESMFDLASEFAASRPGASPDVALSDPRNLPTNLESKRQESERECARASANGDIENTAYWDGRRSGLDEAIASLKESGWTAPTSYPPNEEPVVVLHVTVNRRNGEVNVTADGKLADSGEFESAFDQITEATKGIVSENPELFITDPEPRKVEFNHGSISATDSDGNEFYIHDDEAPTAEFLQDDGEYVYLKLKDGRVVLIDPVDVEIGPSVI